MPFGSFSEGGTGTLASIYAFGLGDNPVLDNLFGMPSGNLRFPGFLNSGAGQLDAGVEYYQNPAAISLPQPPAFQRIQMAANLSGIGGLGNGLFNIYELNDPTWNGTFAALGGPWDVEKVVFSNDVTQGANHTGTTYGSRNYNTDGTSPRQWPDGGTARRAGAMDTSLYNDSFGTPTLVERQAGNGNIEYLLWAVQNGANGQWLTHWNNSAAVPAAGDGPAWLIDIDGRFGHYTPRAVLNPYQITNDPTGAWGWRLFASDGISPTLVDVLDVNTSGGTLNGQTIATQPTAAVGQTATFVSPVIDFAVLGATAIPGLDRAGFVAHVISAKVILDTAAALTAAQASVGNATATVGPFDNYLGIQAFPNLPYPAAPVGVVPFEVNLAVRSSWQLIDLGANPMKVNVTTAVTGGAQTGRVVIVASLLPLPI